MKVQRVRMKRGAHIVFGLAAVCAGLLSRPVAGQQQAEVRPPEVGLVPLPPGAAPKSGTPDTDEYTIGDGDEIEIQVMGRPELSGTHVVGPDGKITLPISGPFELRDETREDAAKKIAASFEEYYTSVDVTVRVTKYGSNRILVLGHVAQPGVLYFDEPPTLLDALSKSHAVAMGAGQNSFPSRCEILRGKNQVVWVDLKSILTDGTTADIPLHRDDVVYVPEEQEDLVTVLGEVQRPGMVKLESTTTLLNVLATTGGLAAGAGKAKIEIVRPSTGVTREIAFTDLLKPAKSTEVSLQRGDVIYVQKGTMAKFAYVLQELAPAGTMLMFGAAVK